MKVLFVSHGIYPLAPAAGVELFTAELAKAVALEHDVTVFVPVRTPAKAPTRGDVDINTEHGYRVIGVPRRSRRLLHDKALVERFARLLGEIRPDLVYFQSIVGLPFGIADEVRAQGIPYIFHLHDYYMICPRVKLLRGGRVCPGPRLLRCAFCGTNPFRHPRTAVRFFAGFRESGRKAREILANARVVLATSLLAREQFVQHGLRRENTMIFPGTLGYEFARLPERSPARLPRIGFFGGPAASKGIEVLAQAAWQVDHDYRIEIHGVRNVRGRERLGRLFARVADKIIIAKSYKPEEVTSILDALDVLVVPSIWPETYGRVADEARSRGVIVLASEAGGMPERLVDGVNAFLFPPGESDALARSLDGILQNLPRMRSELDFALFLPRKDDLTRKILSVISWAASDDRRTPFLLDYSHEVELLADTLDLPRDKVASSLLDKLRSPGKAARDTRVAAAPSNHDSVEHSYPIAKEKLFDSFISHTTRDHRLRTNRALATIRRFGRPAILHLGGAAAWDAVMFALAGLSVTMFEPNPWLRNFANALARERRVKMEVIGDPSQLRGRKYQVAYCDEALEHSPDRVPTIRFLAGCINPGGKLFVTGSFAGVGSTSPNHPPADLPPSGGFVSWVEQLGLQLEEAVDAPGNRLWIFRRLR